MEYEKEETRALEEIEIEGKECGKEDEAQTVAGRILEKCTSLNVRKAQGASPKKERRSSFSPVIKDRESERFMQSILEFAKENKKTCYALLLNQISVDVEKSNGKDSKAVETAVLLHEDGKHEWLLWPDKRFKTLINFDKRLMSRFAMHQKTTPRWIKILTEANLVPGVRMKVWWAGEKTWYPGHANRFTCDGLKVVYDEDDPANKSFDSVSNARRACYI